MRQINLLKDKKRLVRQAVVAWTVLNLGVALFVIIALSLSSILDNQEQIVIITFAITGIFTIIAHIFFYGRDYHFVKPSHLVISEKKNSHEFTKRPTPWGKSNLHTFSTQFKELKAFSLWVFSSLVDGVFLILWVWLQWLVDQVISDLQISFIDQSVLIVIQIVFAISTLIPIIAHMFVTTGRIFLQAREIISRDFSVEDKTAYSELKET